ncbi:MAG: dynamin family protein [Treponema sp.]|nr:dynamin family protein [Treponema sp.]
MTSIDLKYNPYTRTKSLCIDGKEQANDVLSKLCGADGTELSEWVANFFDSVIKHCNDAICVTFSGITRDYDFLEDAAKKSKCASDVRLEKGNVVDVADRLTELKELFKKMQEETPFESLKSDEVKRLFEKATDSEFEMAVVATMSSGKSTLINAMLGRELLPARNEATTANIARIHDIDGEEHFRAESFDRDGKEIEAVDPLTPDEMNRLNNIDGEHPASVVEIYGDIPGIESTNIRLALCDTPGPNNSRTSEHEKHTMDLLNADYKPMIIYVLNGTQLETNDDSILLDNVARLVKSGDRQSRDRFLFVLNRADEFDPDKGESVAKKIDDVKRYLFEKHGIENPRVFPTSAKLAKVIRQTQCNDPALTSKDTRFLKGESGIDAFVEEERMHFTQFADFLSPSTDKELNERIEKARHDNDEDALALLYSGVPSIELAITEYLSKYALPAKITEGVYSFKEKIDALGIEAQAKNELAGNEQKMREMQKNLSLIKASLSKGDKAKEVKKQIESLTVKYKLDVALASVGTKLLSSFGSTIQDMKKKVHTDTARAYIQNIKMRLPKITADFTSSVEKTLDVVMRSQAEQCVMNYKKYVEELIGSVSYDIPAASILGDVATITVDEAVDAYAHEEEVKVGSHTEKKSGFGHSFLRAITFGLYKGEKTVDDYETQEFVDFSKYIDDILYPEIEKFEKETRDVATNWANDEASKFKIFFLGKLAQLDVAIKMKVEEMEKTLSDSKKTEKMIAENKRNLEWLASFTIELDNILSI